MYVHTLHIYAQTASTLMMNREEKKKKINKLYGWPPIVKRKIEKLTMIGTLAWLKLKKVTPATLIFLFLQNPKSQTFCLTNKKKKQTAPPPPTL